MLTKENKFAHRLKQSLNLGPIVYKLFYHPLGRVKQYLKYGFWTMHLAEKNATRIPKRIRKMTTLDLEPIDYRISFLTGKRFWHQTILCAVSLCLRLRRTPQFTIFNDGSLTSEHINIIGKIIPTLIVKDLQECEAVVDSQLPRNKYPNLRKERDQYILMRKLIDVNLLEPGSIYLDSDMIFWKFPKLLINSYLAKLPLFMSEENIPENFGLYATGEDLAKQTGIKPLAHFNSGIFCLVDRKLDWELLEHCATEGRKIKNQKDLRLIEQTLLAQAMSQFSDAVRLTPDYFVAWTHTIPDTTLTHYVHSTKVFYEGLEMERIWKEYSKANRRLHRRWLAP